MTPAGRDLHEASLKAAQQYLPTFLYRFAELSVDGAEAVARANVHAVGVGEKITNGKPTGQLCLRLHVVQKLPPRMIPSGFEIPTELYGFPTDVIESPPVFLRPPRMPRVLATEPDSCTVQRGRRQRPVIAGISFASELVTGGTIACFCRSTRVGEEAQKYALTAGHVLGSVQGGAPGDAVLQPSAGDVGMAPGDSIGVVDRLIPIKRGRHAVNEVDAGIARLDPGIQIDNRVCSIGALAGTRDPELNLPVVKHGRASGLTPGIIKEFPAHTVVTLRHSDLTLVATFVNQIRIDSTDQLAFSEGADSGSLIVDPATKRAVGLLFSGPDVGAFAYANPIGSVLKALDIDLL
jgi:hypothetical protein